jgi:hypothetical protein
VIAAQGGGRIIPIAPASAGLRIAMLTHGFVAVTGEAVDIAQLTTFSFGVGATLTAVGFAIAIAILGPRRRRRLAARDRRAAATAPRRGRPGCVASAVPLTLPERSQWPAEWAVCTASRASPLVSCRAAAAGARVILRVGLEPPLRARRQDGQGVRRLGL